MVVCRYFQQGICRYGQYCRNQHVNNFGTAQGDRNKTYTDVKSVVLGVAEEVLAAERGGQWLLSCFGPFKEQPCIPGMDDVSPEEVRWEMYQAQKNGTVHQTNIQFQQLCQAMTEKREALKSPTHDTITMLDKLQKSCKEGSAFGAKTNFALSTPQMPQPSNTTSSSNVFGAKSFGSTSNPFGGSFSATGGTSSSIFGKSNSSNASLFGGNPVFGAQTNANSVFGGASNTSNATVFGSNQPMQLFATTANTPNSVFSGGTGQTSFAQPTTFGSTSQATSPFSMAQSGQSPKSVFGTTTTTTNNLFGTSTSSGFGSAQTSTNLFASTAAIQQTNPIFGTPVTAAPSSSIFGQQKTTAAFGGAPVFGAATGAFGAAPGASVFGATSAKSTNFGAAAQTANSFGALANPAATPFSGATPATAATPFGSDSTSTTASFVTPNGPFGTPAARTAAQTFGTSAQLGNDGSTAFGTAVQPSTETLFNPTGAGATSAFGAAPASQPFGTPSFGNAPSTPFSSTTSTATISNPFALQSQQINTPFGIAQTTTSSSAGPFGNSPFGATKTTAVIDQAAYTIESELTDDEKSAYMADQFVLGKIPIKPPSIDVPFTDNCEVKILPVGIVKPEYTLPETKPQLFNRYTA